VALEEMLKNVMIKFYEKKIVLSWPPIFVGGEGAFLPSYLIFIPKKVKSAETAMLCVDLCFPQFNFKQSRKSSRNFV
jgi:hypothetical protein